MTWILCVDNTGYEASLEPRKLYQKIADSKAEMLDMYRIIDESGEAYLFAKKCFYEMPISFDETINHALEMA